MTRPSVTGDLAVGLVRHGYRAIAHERSHHRGADTFETRAFGGRAVVLRGRDGARLFYDSGLVRREGAVPRPLADLLFGAGAVHGTDGATHRERKRLFLDLLGATEVEDLATTIGKDLERRVARWPGREVVVFSELVEVYGAAVQAWAGVSSDPARDRRTSHRLAAIVDGFGGAGAAYLEAWVARLRANRWARRLISDVRERSAAARPGSILAELATGAGSELPAELAAVELLNILRPTVAIAWPATFLARDLARFPQWRPLLADRRSRTDFGHEVRRTCPFVPALAGRARRAASIGGVQIAAGDLLVLDVPGTNQDPSYWTDPDTFLPERFDGLLPDPFAFVPQGGGDTTTGHRCPGEPLTVRVLAETARVLAKVDYTPCTATTPDLERIPTLPPRGLPIRVG